VYFYTTRELAFNHAKPKRAIEFTPAWFKNLPTQSIPENIDGVLQLRKNLRSCPGFTSLYSSGFMFQMWSDLHLEAGPDNFKYQFTDEISRILPHRTDQFGNCPIIESHFHIKLENPWWITADKNIDLLFSAPIWNSFGHDDFVVAPGAYSAHVGVLQANINLFVKRQQEKKSWSILLGQPLVHVVPITERQIKLHYELVTEKELLSIMAKSPLYLMDSNKYRRAMKMCPHAK
jgi:hypothetical protein